MIIANQWYNIAKTSTLGSTTGIRIEFGSHYALIAVAVDYGNVVITAVESNIGEEKIKVGARIRYNRGWHADVRISPAIEDADLKASVYENNGWTAVSPNTSTTGTTVCIIDDIDSLIQHTGSGDSLWEKVNIGTKEAPIWGLRPKDIDNTLVGIFSDTFVTAGGRSGSDNSPSNLFTRLDSWDNYDETAGDVLSALLGYGLKQDIEALKKSGLLDESKLKAYLDKYNYLTKAAADLLYAPINSGGLWEKVNIGTEEAPVWAVRPKDIDNTVAGIVSDTFITAGGRNGNSSGQGTATTLGGLVNVDDTADDLQTEDMVLVKGVDATHWTLRALSTLGLNKTELESYLTTNSYLKKDTADGLYASLASFNTLNTKVNDFLTGTDTDSIINKWKELEAFLAGQTETSTLADLLKVKADKTALQAHIDNYNYFVGTTYAAHISAYNTHITEYNTFKDDTQRRLTALEALWAIDAENNGLYPKSGRGIWSESYITAGGIGTSAGDGGLIQTVYGYNSLGGTFDNTVLTDTFNAYTINYLYTEVEKLKSGGTGFSESAMWTALGGSDTNKVIASEHIPNLDWSKIASGKPTLLSGYGIIDFVVETTNSLDNTTAKAGIYRLSSTAPDNHGYGNAITLRYLSSDTFGQLYISYNMNIPKGGVYWRGATIDNTTQSWRLMLDESNYSSYALPLSGGTISGNLVIEGYLYGSGIRFRNNPNNETILSPMSWVNYDLGWYNGSVWKTFAFLDSNVASATKLQTARTIWGQNFDGTSGIYANAGLLHSTVGSYGLSIETQRSPFYGVRTYLNWDEGSTEGVCRIATGNAYQGLVIGFSTGNNYAFTAQNTYSYTDAVVIKKNGNVLIGTTTDAGYKLDIAGTLNATTIYQNGQTLDEYYLPLRGGLMKNAATIQWGNNLCGWNSVSNGLIGMSVFIDDANFGYYSGLSFKGYYGFQIRSHGGADVYQVRRHNSATWGSWLDIIHSGNIGSYNAGSATKLQTARTIWGQSFDGTGNVDGRITINLSSAAPISITQQYSSAWVSCFDAFNSLLSSGQHYNLNWGYSDSARNKAWIGFYYYGTGSVANRLSMGLHSVDDVLSITGNSNVLIGTTTDSGYKLYVNGTLSAGATTVASLETPEVSISDRLWMEDSAITWLNSSGTQTAYITQNTTANAYTFWTKAGLTISSDANVGFAVNTTTSARAIKPMSNGSYNLGDSGLKWYSVYAYNGYFATEVSTDDLYANYVEVSGNIYATGAITAGSDARYKSKLQDVAVDVEVIADAPLFDFVWNDGRKDTKTYLGTTAQYWAQTNFKNAVIPTDNEKLWTMSYSQIAMGNTIVLARELLPIKRKVREIDDLKSRLYKAERKIETLENELKQYRRA